MFARVAFIKVKPDCGTELIENFEQEVMRARKVPGISLVQVQEISNSPFYAID